MDVITGDESIKLFRVPFLAATMFPPLMVYLYLLATPIYKKAACLESTTAENNNCHKIYLRAAIIEKQFSEISVMKMTTLSNDSFVVCPPAGNNKR